MAITKVSSSLIDANLTITGGTVDDTVIGSGTPAAGTFTTIGGTLASSVTGTTQSAGDNSTKVATTGYVETALANMVDSAPSTLDTLNELAAALGDDPNFATTVTNSIALKAPIANPTFTGSFTSPGIDDNADAIAITIDSSENVGIGTGSPLDKLDVGGNLRISDGALVFDKPTVYGFRFLHNDAGNDLSIQQGDSNNANYVTRLNIDSSGNVGIGTSSPEVTAHVSNAVAAGSDNLALRIQNPTNASDARVGIGFHVNAVTGSGWDGAYIQSANSGSDSGDLRFGSVTNNTLTEAMRIDSSGNVGIGTASPDQTLHVHKGSAGTVASQANSVLTLENSTTAVLQFLTPNTDAAQIRFGDPQDNGAGFIQYAHGDNSLQFGTNGPVKMAIDSSGNVLVGTTDTSLYNNTSGGGIALMGSNRLDVARSGDVVATFNRTTDDGVIVQFYDRGTLSGQIGVESAGVFLGNPLNGGGLRIGGDVTAPANSAGSASSNSQDLGTSSFRWKTIYAVNALNTSDEKLKQDIEGLSDAEKRVAVALKGLVKKYRFKDEVAAQGSDAKIRVGLIAQQVVSAFDDEGLTATDYALLSHETDTDAQFNELETKTYSINYSELLAFIISAI